MNRYESIDNFLKFIRDIEVQNPGFIDSKESYHNIYGQLVRIGVSNQERKFKLPNDGMFSRWIDRFAKKKNIDVFVSPNWQYFCQFINEEAEVKGANDHIKVYVPQDSSHIEQSANIIFDFLAKNNIPHLSKIGSDIRFDNIVIRLINPEDEIKLRQFINKNKHIQSGMIPANPFLFQMDGIALACDGRISFNSTIAHYIRMYIQQRKKENNLNSVGVEDFYSFVRKYYQDTFINKTNIKNVKSDFDFDGSLIANYMNVTELILKCSDSRFGYSDYIDHYTKCNNEYLMQQQERALENCYYNSLRNYRVNNNNNYSQTELILTPELRQETNQMLIRMINVLKIRYASQIHARIEKYLETGNVNYMPSDDPNLRTDLANSNFRQALKQILINDNISLHDYIGMLHKPAISNNFDPQKVIELLNFAYQGLNEKYGTRTAIQYLEEYLRTGESTYLTRNKGVRQVISNSNFRQEMLQILNGASLTDYINQTMLNSSANEPQVQPKSKDDFLREALQATYQKYEAAYQAGTSQISGSQWIFSAVMQLIERGSYNGFTRDNQVRQTLSSNVTSNDALEIVSTFYGVNNVGTINREVLQIYTQAYISDIVNQMSNNYQY